MRTMNLLVLTSFACGFGLGVHAPSAQAQESAPNPENAAKPPPGSPALLRKAPKYGNDLGAIRERLQIDSRNRNAAIKDATKLRAVANPMSRASARQLLRKKSPQRYALRNKAETIAILDAIVGDRTLTDEMKIALRTSARRRAQFDRIEELAIAAKDAESLRQLEDLRQAERSRLTMQLRKAMKNGER